MSSYLSPQFKYMIFYIFICNIGITSSNACRNAGILSIEKIISLKSSGKLVKVIKGKKIGASGTLTDIPGWMRCKLCYERKLIYVLRKSFYACAKVRLSYTVAEMS